MSASDRPVRPSSRDGFEVAIICALPLEVDAVDPLFDIYWDEDGPPFNKAPGDANAYSTGVIGRHNVVLAHMPNMGNTTAAQVASFCRMSFPNLRLSLVVGICGVAPFDPNGNEIVLGDVIISSGVVQHDAGWQMPDGFKIRDTLQDSPGRHSAEIRGILAKLKTRRGAKQIVGKMNDYLVDLQRDPELHAGYPGQGRDKLFKASYVHTDRGRSCRKLGCNGRLVQRRRLNGDSGNTQPAVHIGTVASGNSVMRSGTLRDGLAAKEDIIAFEMEAAGVWDIFPCVMIKGACDYADSHKNKAWQRYAAATAASCAKAFLMHWTPYTKGAGHSKGPWFLVPYPRNDGFVGREDILQKLRDDSLPSDRRSRLALSGLGGVGKTQIAIEHAYWLKNTHADMSVFWVHASNAQRFQQSFAAIAKTCQIPGFSDPKGDMIQLVKSWMESSACGPWLMLIDNADDKELFFPDNTEDANVVGLGRHIPDCNHGVVFLTTRNKKLGSRFMRGRPSVEVRVLKPEESDKLLQVALQTTSFHPSDLFLLSSRLERLPLALSQAAAFIHENSISASRYLQLLDEGDQTEIDLLSNEFETVGRDPTASRAVAETWMLSFQQMERRNRLASELLALMSLLDRHAIPRLFLSHYAKNLGKKEWRTKELVDAEGTLKSYSFVTEEGGDNMSIHRLVQLVTRKWLHQMKQSRYYEQMAILTVSDLYPEFDYEANKSCIEWLPHAYAVLRLGNKPSTETLLSKADLYDCIYPHLLFQGWYDDAEICGIKCLRIRERLQGRGHRKTLHTMADLAWTYNRQGQFEKAEKLQTVVLNASRDKYGKAHRATLDAMNDLARTLERQCRQDEAEQLQVEVLNGRRALLGETHSDTLSAMENLAVVLKGQGRLEEAEELQVQVLRGMKSELGETHPYTLTSMSNLAMTYSLQHRFQEAEKLFAEALDIHQTKSGETHIETLAAMSDLADLFRAQGRLGESEKLELQALEERRRRLGENHPDTLISKDHLVVLYHRQRRYKEAEELGTQLLGLRNAALGPNHPDTLKSMHDLAECIHSLGRSSEAIEMLKECNRLGKSVYSPGHPDVVSWTRRLDNWKKELEDK